MITYRPAARTDIPGLVDIERQQPRCAQWGETGWTQELAEKSAYILCAQSGEKVVGFVALRLAADVCEVLNVGVAVASAQQGIGFSLLSQALAWVRAHGGKTVTLEVGAQNAAATHLYQKAGFTRLGMRKQFYASGEDAWIMGKTL